MEGPPPGSQMEDLDVKNPEAINKAARSQAVAGSVTATQDPVLPHLHLLQTYLAPLKGESSPVSSYLRVKATATDLDRICFCFPTLPALLFALR